MLVKSDEDPVTTGSIYSTIMGQSTLSDAKFVLRM